MGCFDTVRFPCPECGQRVEVQSKADECRLRLFSLASAPNKIKADIEGQHICPNGHKVEVQVQSIASVFTTEEQLDGEY